MNQNNPALFATFVMSLASAALIEMGVVEDPTTKKKRKNVEAARTHIDILAMFADKTRGNLSGEEKDMLEKVLTDLKLQFAKSAGGEK